MSDSVARVSSRAAAAQLALSCATHLSSASSRLPIAASSLSQLLSFFAHIGAKRTFLISFDPIFSHSVASILHEFLRHGNSERLFPSVGNALLKTLPASHFGSMRKL